MKMKEESTKTKSPAKLWLKRLGLVGFLFFFIKGLLWLGLIIAATYFGYNVLE